MSSINQILNNALMETALFETKTTELKSGGYATPEWIARQKQQQAPDNSVSQDRLDRLEKRGFGNDTEMSKTTPSQANYDPDKHGPKGEIIPGTFPEGKKSWWDNHPDAWKYAAGTTAALGAGLGALALAKKLRSKKEAAKAKK